MSSNSYVLNLKNYETHINEKMLENQKTDHFLYFYLNDFLLTEHLKSCKCCINISNGYFSHLSQTFFERMKNE